ncbi:MAG: hypothetical protein J5680_07135, partial [Neisseriaceae bacterium]|nr:hypothetical protein [Neisseriaceae bacterium]
NYFVLRPLLVIGYLKIIFNFVSLVKNNFQRLPRLTLVRLAMTVRVSGSLNMAHCSLLKYRLS